MTKLINLTTTSQSSPPPKQPPLDILILGAGWSSHFLTPLLTLHNLTYALTTRTGHDATIPFTYTPCASPPSSEELEPYTSLPDARTVLVTFPLKGVGQSAQLTSMYELTRDGPEGSGEERNKVRWIQLGSSGIFKNESWNTSTSPYDLTNERAVAEDELLFLHSSNACVLNLAGLYGGERRPRNWVGRVMKSKEDVKKKGALHLVHGDDVARGIVGCLVDKGEGGGGEGKGGRGWEAVKGKRWIVTDLRVYDWWELAMGWGVGGEGGEEGKRWVVELMEEEGVRALPREQGKLGRVLDGRAFWEAIGWWPGKGRMS